MRLSVRSALVTGKHHNALVSSKIHYKLLCSTCFILYYELSYGFLMCSIKTIMDDYIRPLMILYLACAGAVSNFGVTQFHTLKIRRASPLVLYSL